MQKFPTSPWAMFESFWRNRNLISVFVVREVAGRYRGSILGVLWSVFNPIFMLAVYTFVFSVVFKVRWSVGDESKGKFALVLFAGLMVFNLFAECIGRAPFLVLANANYVKKVVFPLEIFPWVTFGAALFHTLISLVVWLIFYTIILGVPHATIFFFPLLLVPMTLLVMGLSWFLAAIGVFLRDVGQIVGVIVTTLMFLTPIFYPLSAIPKKYWIFLYLNPLTFIVEQTRGLLIFGIHPAWGNLCLMTAITFLVAWLGFFWFQKTRKGFADVI